MKYLFVNTVCSVGSTGRICENLAKDLIKQDNEVIVAYGRDSKIDDDFKKYTYKIGNNLSIYSHVLITRLFDKHGFGSKEATRKFIKWANKYNPDVLWLHNLHGYYINIELLFNWIKSRPNMSVKWTLHDCWAFTGHCVHFSYEKCTQWKNHCVYCKQLNTYPKDILFSNVSKNYLRKKSAFTGVKDLTIITPSKWLANLVKDSYLKEYKIEVKYNTIDTNIFKYTPSDYKERLGLQDKIVILGVANVWDKRKGLDDFYKLATMLDEKYAIVLVGLNDKQIKDCPKSIKNISRTDNINELVKIYSMADFFVNPSVEETFGLTTKEAEACGTKTIVYKDTACEEVSNGVVVKQDVKEIYKAITGQIYKN